MILYGPGEKVMLISSGARGVVQQMWFEDTDGSDTLTGTQYTSTYYSIQTEGKLLSRISAFDVVSDGPAAPIPSVENLLAWKQGLPTRPDNETLGPIVSMLLAIQYDKEGHYGSSWKGKGEYRGIMANIDRKYDRLDHMTQQEIAGVLRNLFEQEKLLVDNYDLYSAQTGESKVDAVADLANYCLLYLGYIRQQYPNVFKVWVEKNVPTYLSDKIPFIEK